MKILLFSYICCTVWKFSVSQIQAGSKLKKTEVNLDIFFTAECLNKEIITTCKSLADCLSSNVIKYAKDTNDKCLENYNENKNSKNSDIFRCHLAPTAFITLEKIREFLMETISASDEKYIHVTSFLRTLCDSSSEEKENFSIEPPDDGIDKNLKYSDPDNVMMFKQLNAYHKFFASAGEYLKEDESIGKEIFEAEFNRNIKALGALVVSFGLPGIFSLCEPSHLKTTLFLQFLSLTIVSFYQFIRKGLWWTLLSLGACLLVLFVQFGLLYLLRGRHKPEKPIVLRE